MLCQIPDLVARVRSLAGQPPAETPIFRDPGVYDLDARIRLAIIDAARAAILEAPVADLADAAVDMAGRGVYRHPAVDGCHGGHILLPQDFLRLVSYRMSDWAAPVTTALQPGDPRYHLGDSPYSGVRGTPYAPVCRIVSLPEGLALEYQSCRDPRAGVADARYIALPQPDRGDSLRLPRLLVAPILAAAALSITNPKNQDR